MVNSINVQLIIILIIIIIIKIIIKRQFVRRHNTSVDITRACLLV